MPCMPPQHFPCQPPPFPWPLYQSTSIQHMTLSFHDNYCKTGTGPFLFTVIQVASSPKETVPMPLPTFQSTITKTINRWDRRSDGVPTIWLFTYCTKYFGLVGESGWLPRSFEKILQGGCPHHLLQKICSDSSCVQDA